MSKSKEPLGQGKSIDEIPVGGTLGILAAGYRGIMLWRRARWEHQQAQLRAEQKVKGDNAKK